MASKTSFSLSCISCSNNLFRYRPVVVEHSDDNRSFDRFILHQGIQRRIGITICHENAHTEMNWKNVREVIVGKSFDLISQSSYSFQVEYVVNWNQLPMNPMRKFSR